MKIRAANTQFGEMVLGAAELNLALNGTLEADTAFVIPLIESTGESKTANITNETLLERFGVIVAIANDESQAEVYGVTAYDKLHEIRSELFGCLLGWEIPEGESQLHYRGGKLIQLSGAYLWYQFEFEYQARLQQVGIADDVPINGVLDRTLTDGRISSFDRIYTQFVQAQDTRLPLTDIPYPDGFPSVKIPDASQMIDLTKNPLDGAFTRAWASAFDVNRS
jgi:hypothetical protein